MSKCIQVQQKEDISNYFANLREISLTQALLNSPNNKTLILDRINCNKH